MSFTRDTLRLAAAGTLGTAFIAGLGSTLRISVRGIENVDAARREGSGRILFAIWHAHMLLSAYHHRGQGIRVLVSQHHDGELIARVIARLGFGTVRGSTTRGGRDAFFRMVREAAGGHDIAITPDGPRGPREVVQEGVVRLAQRSGLPVVAFAACGPRDWTLRSWDRFRIPRPGSRVAIVYGAPVNVPRDLRDDDVERYRREIESRLENVVAEAMKI